MSDFYSSEDWLDFPSGHPGGLEATRRLLTMAKLEKGSSVLDLACGRGESFPILYENHCQITGLDSSEAALEKAALDYPYARLVSGDLTSLPFYGNEFKALLCQCSLSLVFANLSKVLKEAARILEPNGALLISDIYVCQAGKEDDFTGTLQRGDGKENISYILPTKAAWRYQFERAGFQILSWEDMSKEWKEFIGRWLWKYENSFPLCACETIKDIPYTELSYFQTVLRHF